jgi:hypothetical protein
VLLCETKFILASINLVNPSFITSIDTSTELSKPMDGIFTTFLRGKLFLCNIFFVKSMYEKIYVIFRFNFLFFQLCRSADHPTLAAMLDYLLFCNLYAICGCGIFGLRERLRAEIFLGNFVICEAEFSGILIFSAHVFGDNKNTTTI